MEKILKITSLKAKESTFNYWLTKSDMDRLSAIEILRQHYFSLNNNVQPRLQRICHIVTKT
ncbi:MAG: hypothetical protein WCR21_04065, partial [Bacteroidota bacterium]